MFSSYRYHTFHPILKPARLLTDNEKKIILENFAKHNSYIHTIYIDDFLAISLDAQIGDIISLKDSVSEVYRQVVYRK